MEETTVECLINKGTRTWNATMVDGIFAPQEVEEIKNIPLARKETEDTLYWPWEQDGKTGYRFLKEDEVGFQVSEHQDHEKELWKKIWTLECPNKVRNLIWRACRNSLPSKCNLMRRTIITEQRCDRCKEEMKTLCMRYGVTRGWTKYGRWIILGVLGTKGTSLVLVSY